MSYDFGSQTLGIQNPFKVEGRLRTLTGLLLFIVGIIPLLKVAPTLKEDLILGYTYAILGFIFVAAGVRYMGVGIFQLFRYFVGRSVPTSLAFNRSQSERESAEKEKKALLYTSEELQSMLMGRKNTTFLEPVGWIARLLHSILPKMTFLPYPVRHLAQELAAMSLNFITAIIAYLIIWFVVSSGLAGEVAKEITMPILSIVLLIFLVGYWRKAAKAIEKPSETQMRASGGMSFGAIVALSIIVPVLSGFVLDSATGLTAQEIQQNLSDLPVFGPWMNLAILFVSLGVVLVGVVPNLKKRLALVTPQTDVSEYRDNLQESVHPNEIFINIENIVLANRRYKEIPNRIYKNFDPQLKEQSEGKGSFFGELLVETQPELAENEFTLAKGTKWLSTVLAQVMVLIGFVFFALFALSVSDLVSFILNNEFNRISHETLVQGLTLFNHTLFTLLAWLTCSAAGRILNNASHLFWGELQFSSLLMAMKTEGTFTESKISTGMSIHDSTRSENTVVRSSITPWVITSRITSSIFATTGSANLESPRFIMGMSKNDAELGQIVDEIKSFLRGREAIASITNESDLQNAGTIHEVNQQTRAHMDVNSAAKLTAQKDEEAAGYLRQEDPKKDA
jgi:uncharacterized protein YjeT (DUF2065 family)